MLPIIAFDRNEWHLISRCYVLPIKLGQMYRNLTSVFPLALNVVGRFTALFWREKEPHYFIYIRRSVVSVLNGSGTFDFHAS